jgi:cell division protein FtsN
MKCEECLKVIEEYFDGELEERAAKRVSEHLMKCEACAHELEALRDEQNLYALYRRDVEPSPALWNAVAARIREEKAPEDEPLAARLRRRFAELFGTPRLSPALTFALLILAVGATAGLMKFMQSRQAAPQPVAHKQPDSSQPAQPKPSETPVSTPADKESAPVVNDDERLARQDEENNRNEERTAYKVADKVEGKRVASQTVGFTDEVSPEQLVREAEQKYRAAIALLERDANRRRTLLEPDVRARFDQTLAAVDRTINETRRAARQQPDDPVAVQYMLAAYSKKVEVLREMAASRAYDRGIQ